MFEMRRAQERGHLNHGWLDSYHTFSFGGYFDPKYVGFSNLRVINDDTVSAGGGFPTHAHSDMEIVSYVLEGALEHKDSMGNGSVIRPGDVQRMSAGSGVTHSEYNHSSTDAVRFLQIWVLPEMNGLEPSYEQRFFSEANKRGRLVLIGSRDGRDGSVTIHQNVDLYATVLADGESVTHALTQGRKCWVQVARGSVELNEQQLHPGDGVAIEGAVTITLTGSSDTEVLLFDMG